MYQHATGNRVNDLRHLDKRNLVGCLFILAMMVSPFIASLFGLGFGLLVLTVGLALTAALAFDARRQAPPERRTAVLLIALLALGLAAVTGIAAVIRLR